MKFTWFHLMPYRYLPEDFKDKYRSVWVDIPRDLYDPKVGHRLYNDYLDQLEFADQMGFDGLGVNEHHQNAYGLMPSPNLMGAAMARRTRNANLVILGNSIALYNPPVRVAEEFAMLDVMSGGRLVAGFPVGTSMDTNFCYGEVPATLREKYHEAHDLIIKSWTEPDVFAFNGKYTKLRYVNLWPKPLQQPHPPIWIPGGGSVETWDFVADHDYATGGGPDSVVLGDLNGDGKVDQTDVTAIGKSSFPQLTYSFGANINYAGFDLGAFFQGAAGAAVNLLTAAPLQTQELVNNGNAYAIAKGAWSYYPSQGIDTRATATYPRLTTIGNTNNYRNSSFWIKSGDFLRIRNIELGYNLSTALLHRVGLTKLRIYVNAVNPVTWSSLLKDYKMDPETLTGYPALKSYNTGIALTF